MKVNEIESEEKKIYIIMNNLILKENFKKIMQI